MATHVEINCLPIVPYPNLLEKTLQFFAFLNLSQDGAQVSQTMKVEIVNSLTILVTCYDGSPTSQKNILDLRTVSDEVLVKLLGPALINATGCDYLMADFIIQRIKEESDGTVTEKSVVTPSFTDLL